MQCEMQLQGAIFIIHTIALIFVFLVTIIILFERSVERYIYKILPLANSDNPLSLQDKMLLNASFLCRLFLAKYDSPKNACVGGLILCSRYSYLVTQSYFQRSFFFN